MSSTALTDRQASVWASYQRMRTQLSGRLGRELTRETGLSEADYEILSAIIDSPDSSVRSLALRCGLSWEKSRLSHQLRRMTERGLVVRDECAEDNRGFIVRASEAGRLAAEAARNHHEAAVRRYVTDVLSAEQLDSLDTIANIVLTTIEREDPHA
ncbi:MAG: MarR family winged helix-turn-helix transcriptional regulator [Lacisediminihabitans sp.]